VLSTVLIPHPPCIITVSIVKTWWLSRDPWKVTFHNPIKLKRVADVRALCPGTRKGPQIKKAGPIVGPALRDSAKSWRDSKLFYVLDGRADLRARGSLLGLSALLQQRQKSSGAHGEEVEAFKAL